MAAKFGGNYWLIWLRWHLYRKYRKPDDRSTHYKAAVLRMRTLLRELPQGSLIIDCGANVGEVSEFFLRQGMKVIAFEPDPVALRAFKSRLANEPNLRLEEKAVGARPAVAPLFQRATLDAKGLQATESSSLIHRDVHNAEPVGEVEVVDLIAYLKHLPEKVRILKLDIEGYEADIVEAMLDDGIYRDIDLILVETHERFSPELAARLGRIRERVRDQRIGNICLDWH
ncbi:MAG: FkbM family methyltransferase [Sinimarinibacterium sp.]|jgi:FkbM family methyltransferase